MTTLHLPGQAVEVTADDRKDWQGLSGLGLTVEILQRQDVLGVVRGEPLERAKLDGAEDSDVVELQFDGGVRQYLSVAELRNESTTQRGGTEDVVEVPVVFSRGTAGTTRGAFDWVLRGLRVLRIRPDAALADLGETAVVDRFESSLTPPPGLYRIDTNGTLKSNATNLDIAGPWLLFIHGTASSTNGSFGDLFGTHEWLLLRKFYDDRILAFQHKTLSASPIDNALELVPLLPARARLHLVTHSRGGLIGELLGIDSFDEKKALRAFERRHREEEAAKLIQLRDQVKAKQFTIEKFVRVAAPARGTILASKRLDVYLSVLLNVIGALPILAADPLYTILKASALELIRRRTKPDRLPGLEAMMPESPLIHFLNQGQGLSSASDLAVIAGDLQGEGFWGRLKAFVTDAFYLEEHDLVVNTAAMFGGVGRKTASGVYDRGATVNHFSYFSNERTRARLHAWLTSAPNAGFEPFDPGKTGINIPPLRAGTDPQRQVLFVVPDVLGSVLALNDAGTAVWLDVAGLSTHGFAVAADRTETKAKDLAGLTYQVLIDGFSATHEVIPFFWDWRVSISLAAAALEERIAGVKNDRVIHLIGHGAGGLAIRMLSDAAWGRIKGRALLLATPEHGMFAAAEWCSPRSRLVRMLALADGAMGADEIAASFRTFDGVLELLPDELLDAQTRVAAWKRMGIPKPGDAKLDLAAGFRKSMPPPRTEMIGIAGRAAETPVGYDALKNESVLSSSGDGRVTTESLHDGIKRWRVEAAHGDLPSHAGSFSAYAQLLNEGTTALLSQPQKVTAGLTTKPLLEESLLFPSLRDLVSEALASRADRSTQEDYPLAVSVTHGDLRMARHPVAVGHHVGDSIVSAEAVLDCQLGRRLSQRFQMGLYPAAIGTSEVIRDVQASPPGAIIIGLGQVGGVTAEVIRRGVAAAALRNALAVAEDREPVQEAWRSAAFASVVIGTRGGSKLTSLESIGAIIRGAIDANRMLRRQKLWDRVRIDAVELIELYEQRAISTVYAARYAVTDVTSELELGERVDLVPLLRPTKSGQFRIPPEDWQTGWWQRMSITMEPPQPDHPDEKDRPFKYLVLTDRARVEASLQCHDPVSTWNLIRSAIGTPRFDPEISGALFELLVPNEIKTAADTASRVVLILDADTAQYPWEMLADSTRSDRQPQSVRSGMIRQFVTVPGSYRSSPRYAESRNAFVIGDTDINGPVGKDKVTMPKLPGAQAEAQAVSLTLSGAGYQVTTLIRKDAMTIEKQLFARQYRILHLAGHGHYNAERPAESGMVLGPDIYLTACQLQQMRIVPDLVFINCCFLGRIDIPPVGGQPHRLAASVAQELIGMGVKAIVAAGWAVDDAAGVTFASTFYDGMLNQRKQFGDAVSEAREAVFRKHASTNTWAAYQCYGNPGFTLADQRESGAALDGSQFCARREYVDELLSLAAQANTLGSGDDAKTQKERLAGALRDLSARVPADWNDGELLMRAGFACRALGDFQQAADFLEKAVTHQSGKVSLEGVEILGNMYSRLAIERHREGDHEKRDKHFERASELFDLLVHLAPSSERWSLLGSAQKKRAAVVSGQERLDLLEESAASYGRAANGTLVYPLLNQVAVVWVRNGVVPEELQKQFDAAQDVVQGLRNSSDFWERVGTPDYDLTRQLVAGDLQADALERQYLAAAQKSGSDGDKRSVIEQIEFLAEMLSEIPDRKTLRDKLLELAQRLRTAWQIKGGKF